MLVGTGPVALLLLGLPKVLLQLIQLVELLALLLHVLKGACCVLEGLRGLLLSGRWRLRGAGLRLRLGGLR